MFGVFTTAYSEIEPVGGVPAADAETVERTLAQVASLPEPSPSLWWAALRGFAAAARLRTGRAFVDLPLARRRALLARWTAPGELRRAGALRRVIDLVLAPILTGHFGRPDFPWEKLV